MNVWSIVILIVVGSICVTTGIAFVYYSIVNTVERYQIRKAKRELEIYKVVLESIPEMFKKTIEMIEKPKE